MKPSTLTTALLIFGFALFSSSYATDATMLQKAAMKIAPTGPIIAQKTVPMLTESDSVQLSGGKLSGGWRENSADGSWRRVAFVLQGHAATVTFGDGRSGSRVPSVTRYAYAGPGSKNAKLGSTYAVYSEAHAAADATPQIRTKANRSSLVPAEVAVRVRELGGDVKVLQQLADVKRLSEMGSAFDAASGAAGDKGFFGDRPGGSPGRTAGGWKDPRAGVGRDGRASDDGDEIISSNSSADADGRRSTSVTRHRDNSTTEVSTESNNDGSSSDERTDKDPTGSVTRRRSEHTDSSGNSTVVDITYDAGTGEIRSTTSTKNSDNSWSLRTNRVFTHTTPSETPYSGRGGIDEAWMDKSLPWFMDAVYIAWKSESDLIQSGGRIAQPGRDEHSSPGTRESPKVGAVAVTNCGDSGTNPCAPIGGTEVDIEGRLGGLSQPGRGEPGGIEVPDRLPVPPPEP